jgi:hypothetical protein
VSFAPPANPPDEPCYLGPPSSAGSHPWCPQTSSRSARLASPTDGPRSVRPDIRLAFSFSLAFAENRGIGDCRLTDEPRELNDDVLGC